MKGKGFTLVELITVIIILGILAVYAAPRFFTGGDSDVVAAEVSLASLLRAQQQRAMQDTANTGYGVNFEEQNGYILVRPVNQGTVTDINERSVIRIDSQISVESVLSELRFNGSGCLFECGGANHQITLTGVQARYICINSQGFISSRRCEQG